MKRRVSLLFSGLTAMGLLVYFSSCQKANSFRPSINLLTADAYVSKDTTLASDTTFTVYLTASKAGPDQLLKSAKISKSINGGPDSILQQMTLSTSYFFQFYSYRTGDSGTTERYTFSVTQSNDQSSDTSIVITVN